MPRFVDLKDVYVYDPFQTTTSLQSITINVERINYIKTVTLSSVLYVIVRFDNHEVKLADPTDTLALYEQIRRALQ